ncbi:MAG: hypothetical protein Q9178_005294 [Gyalolechia marmorata]
MKLFASGRAPIFTSRLCVSIQRGLLEDISILLLPVTFDLSQKRLASPSAPLKQTSSQVGKPFIRDTGSSITMEDGSGDIQRPAGSPGADRGPPPGVDRGPPPGVERGPQRQALPDFIISPGVMVVSTQSGTKAIFTTAPTHFTGVHSILSTDPQTFTTPLTPTTLPSTGPVSSQVGSASSTPSVPSAPSRPLSTGELVAVIVVPLVLLAILSPILTILYINWRRKRRNANRRSDRSTKSLIEQYHEAPRTSRHYKKRAVTITPPRKSRKPYRIISVPTPTFSSFNFELSRPASVDPPQIVNEQPTNRAIPRDRRSATLSWGAPPPYTSPIREAHCPSPSPRIITPSVSGSPLIEAAQMVHLRPFSGQRPGLHGSTSRPSTAAEPSTSLARGTMFQPPDTTWTRQGSADSAADSLQHRSTLQRPFTFHGLPSPTFSDVSGLSFDPTLWASTTYGRDSVISPIDDEDETERRRPHRVA